MKLSIIIPVFNRGKIVPICIRKILETEYQDYEIILVDDGSSDNSYEECKKLTLEFPQIHVYHQSNKGVSSARNLGIDKATGEYILFVDSDDIIIPKSFPQIEHLAMNNADVIMFRHGYIDSSNLDSINSKHLLLDEPLMLLGNKEIVTWIFTTLNPYQVPYYSVWGKAIKRKFLLENNIRFREDVSLGEDQIFTCELLSHIQTFVYTASKFYLIIHWPKTMRSFGLGSYHRSMDDYLHCQVANYEGLIRLYSVTDVISVKEYAVNYILDRPITRILFRNVGFCIKNKISYSKLKQFCYNRIIPVLKLESDNLVQLKNKNITCIIRMLLGNMPFPLIYSYCFVWVNVLDKGIRVMKRLNTIVIR